MDQQEMLYPIGIQTFSEIRERNYVYVEVRTPRGRVDMVLRTPSRLYVIELKLDGSADSAMDQIDLKSYPERFALCGLPVVKEGISFDRKRRTIGDMDNRIEWS